MRQKTVEQLNPRQRTLYEILQDEGELNPGELYDRYTERVEELKTKRTIQNYLSKMD